MIVILALPGSKYCRYRYPIALAVRNNIGMDW
jgi:hypothetical protein